MPSPDAIVTGPNRYEAEIRRTAYGVAHIRAESWGSLGFGQGYACAQDHGATIVDQIVKVRAQRSLHLGRGKGDAHLNSDIGYAALSLHRIAESMMAGQSDRLRELMDGYAAGVNAWLAERDPSRLPAWCAPLWTHKITTVDVYAYAADLARAASARNLISYIALARPPGPDGMAPTPPMPSVTGGEMASNGWAIGRSRTMSGNGMVVANPHFPWYGEGRFWENHLTIPGTIDVYGASLVGAPGIQIGFNRHVAWTHTFSIGKRFTLYRLALEPGCPTRYRYGDQVRDMESYQVAVNVLDDDGSVNTETRTLWHSHYGPMLNPPLLGWSDGFGFTFRDANHHGERFVSQWIGMASASSLDEFREVFRSENGVPWVTTLAADAQGRAWYIDASHTPHLSFEGAKTYAEELATNPIAQLFDQNRVAMLDGSNPACEWVDEDGAPAPGLVPFEKLPELERDDWVANANESHWLTNPSSPLVGYSILMGKEDFAPSPRTRANLVALSEPGPGPGPASGPEGRMDLEAAVSRLLSNRSVLADTLCEPMVARLRRAGNLESGGRSYDLGGAADVLASWDHTFDLDARGAILWREIMAGFADAELCEPGRLFAEPFSLKEPFATPRGMSEVPDGGADPIAEAALSALVALEKAGIPIDTPLGEVQWARRAGRRVAVHGGAETDGVANILMPIGLMPRSSLEPVPPPAPSISGRTERTGLRVGGYEVTYGTSFLMAVEMRPDGPVAQGLLAYGQSEDPDSPHYTDQIVLYASKRMRPMYFAESDIESDPALRVQRVRG